MKKLPEMRILIAAFVFLFFQMFSFGKLLAQEKLECKLTVGVMGDLAFSPLGDRLAVSEAIHGIVKVYQIDRSGYHLLGQPIKSKDFMTYFGKSCAFSGDGEFLAIGAPKMGLTGKVLFYKFIDGNWQKEILELQGSEEDAEFGNTIALSNNGEIIAISSHGAGEHGKVEIFKKTPEGWTPLGRSINGQIGDKIYGIDLDIAADGQTIVVSTHRNNEHSCEGIVDIFELKDDDWVPKGERITCQPGQGTMIGFKVSIAADGNTIVTSTSGRAPGALVYTYEDENWILINNGLEDVAANAASTKVALSDDGRMLAIGFGRIGEKGEVRLFNYENDSWIKIEGQFICNGLLNNFTFSKEQRMVVTGSVKQRRNMEIFKF